MTVSRLVSDIRSETNWLTGDSALAGVDTRGEATLMTDADGAVDTNEGRTSSARSLRMRALSAVCGLGTRMAVLGPVCSAIRSLSIWFDCPETCGAAYSADEEETETNAGGYFGQRCVIRFG